MGGADLTDPREEGLQKDQSVCTKQLGVRVWGKENPKQDVELTGKKGPGQCKGLRGREGKGEQNQNPGCGGLRRRRGALGDASVPSQRAQGPQPRRLADRTNCRPHLDRVEFARQHHLQVQQQSDGDVKEEVEAQ